MVFAPLNRWVSGHTGPLSPGGVEASLPPLPQTPHLFSSDSGPGVCSPAFWSTMSDHTTATLNPLSSLRGKCPDPEPLPASL